MKHRPIVPIKKAEMTITIFFPDLRRSDLSNKAESIMDLLVDNRFIEDDNHEVVPKLTLISGGIDRKEPRCEINIDIIA